LRRRKERTKRRMARKKRKRHHMVRRKIWAPRVIACHMEIDGIMPAVKLGRRHTLSPEMEGIVGEISALSAEWTRNVRVALLVLEEVYQMAGIQPTQNAALGARTLILEDGPELIKAQGPHAEKGGEMSEGMHAQGCSLLESAKIREVK
jgi:hypothetical protein